MVGSMAPLQPEAGFSASHAKVLSPGVSSDGSASTMLDFTPSSASPVVSPDGGAEPAGSYGSVGVLSPLDSPLGTPTSARRLGRTRRMSAGDAPRPQLHLAISPTDLSSRGSRGIGALGGLKQRFEMRGRSNSQTRSKRYGLDITGLRKALLIRVLGVDTTRQPQTHKRRLSTGSLPTAGWLRRRPSMGQADEPIGLLVIWVLDVESGHDWRIRKSAVDLIALNEVCNALRPTLAGQFPIRKTRAEAMNSPVTLTHEKCDKLERYLRILSSMVLDASPSASSYAVSKTVQDFLGATERSEMLTELQHRSGDVARQLVQVYACDVLRSNTTLEKRLTNYVEEVQGCDVARSDVLRSLSVFIGAMAAEVMKEYGERFRAILEVTRKQGSAKLADDEADAVCLAAVRRIIEAETYVPLMCKVRERLAVELSADEETRLARKLDVLKNRPQTFYGVSLQQISISSWETAVQLLRRLGEATLLPSDKLDVLVGAVKEIHTIYRREHPDEDALGADDLMPIMIYVLVQSGVTNLVGIKTVLAALCDPARLLSEAGYCVATLEAAMEYLVRLDEQAPSP